MSNPIKRRRGARPVGPGLALGLARGLALALALALVASVLVVGPAVAARGGPGGGGAAATVGFDPNPVAVGGQYVVTGAGFRPNTWVTVGARYPGATTWTSGETDGAGAFRLTVRADAAGQIVHDVYQKRSHSYALVTSATLRVQ